MSSDIYLSRICWVFALNDIHIAPEEVVSLALVQADLVETDTPTRKFVTSQTKCLLERVRA